MPSRDSRVWVWRWPEDNTAFVFVGDSFEPTRRWRSRSDFGSQLNDKLLELKAQPMPEDRPPYGVSLMLYPKQAGAVAATMQKRLQDAGYKILKSRDRSTYGGGHQPKKPCFVPTPYSISWFPSVMAAARATGEDSSSISRKCKSRRHFDYQFDTPECSALNRQFRDGLQSLLDEHGGNWKGSVRHLWTQWMLDRRRYGNIVQHFPSCRDLRKSLSCRCNQLIVEGVHVEIEGQMLNIEDIRTDDEKVR